MPLRLDFGAPKESGRWLRIDAPTAVAFLPGVGLRMTCSGQLHYPLPILPDDYTIRSASLTMRPAIVVLDGEPLLTLNLTLDDLDLSRVPGFVDATVLASVNDRLVEHTSKVAWRFTRTLTRTFGLGAHVSLVGRLCMATDAGALEVTDDGVIMAVTMGLSFSRSDPAAAPDPVPPATPELPEPSQPLPAPREPVDAVAPATPFLSTKT